MTGVLEVISKILLPKYFEVDCDKEVKHAAKVRLLALDLINTNKHKDMDGVIKGLSQKREVPSLVIHFQSIQLKDELNYATKKGFGC